MPERQYTEKEEEKAEKEQEKEEKSWEEKWRRDPLGAFGWAAILIWAGLVLLAENLGLWAGLEWFDAWGLIFLGAGVIVLLGVVVRLVMPEYRRAVGGTIIWGAILLGIGLGKLIGAEVVWPLILIAIGLGFLLRSFVRGL